MTRVSLPALLCLLAAPLAHASEEEPAAAVPALEPAGEFRVDAPGGFAKMVAIASPSGRHLAVCFAPRSDQARRADTWTSLRLIDLGKARVTGSWDELTLGGLPPAFSPDGALFAFGARKDATTLTVHVRACATGRGVTADVTHPAASLGFAEVCAVSTNAQRVAIREPASADGSRSLIVWDLKGQRRIARYEQPARRLQRPVERVILTGPQIVFDTAEAREHEVVETGLRIVELDTSRVIADVDAIRPSSAWRLPLTPDRRRLLTGTRDWKVATVDLETGERETVLDTRGLLTGSFDLLLSGDGSRAVAWSGRRRVLLAFPVAAAGAEAARIDLEHRAHVLGVGPKGRWAYVAVPGEGLGAVDLDAGRLAGIVTTDLPLWARVTPGGRFLVTGKNDDTGWTFAVFALKTP